MMAPVVTVPLGRPRSFPQSLHARLLTTGGRAVFGAAGRRRSLPPQSGPTCACYRSGTGGRYTPPFARALYTGRGAGVKRLGAKIGGRRRSIQLPLSHVSNDAQDGREGRDGVHVRGRFLHLNAAIIRQLGMSDLAQGIDLIRHVVQPPALAETQAFCEHSPGIAPSEWVVGVRHDQRPHARRGRLPPRRGSLSVRGLEGWGERLGQEVTWRRRRGRA
jgi:hypothetical protein